MQTPSIQTLNIVKEKIDAISKDVVKQQRENSLVLNDEILIELMNPNDRSPYFLIAAANNLSFFHIISDEIHVLDYSALNMIILTFYNENKKCGVTNLIINKNSQKE